MRSSPKGVRSSFSQEIEALLSQFAERLPNSEKRTPGTAAKPEYFFIIPHFLCGSNLIFQVRSKGREKIYIMRCVICKLTKEVEIRIIKSYRHNQSTLGDGDTGCGNGFIC